MSLHRTSFCFVCTHLSSGEKDGDELRRNSDVLEILRKTRFPPVNGQDRATSPETILDHDRVIWLGDLNYRIALSYRTAKALVEMRNWKVLLENDQVVKERERERERLFKLHRLKWLFLFPSLGAATDRAAVGPRLCGVERGENLLPPHLQIFHQLRSVCWL